MKLLDFLATGVAPSRVSQRSGWGVVVEGDDAPGRRLGVEAAAPCRVVLDPGQAERVDGGIVAIHLGGDDFRPVGDAGSGVVRVFGADDEGRAFGQEGQVQVAERVAVAVAGILGPVTT